MTGDEPSAFTHLPNAGRVIIDPVKLVDYLLNANHRDGGSKARFFLQFGYTRERWEDLASALRQHAIDNPARMVGKTSFGEKWLTEGPLPSPDGRAPLVRAAWIVEADSDGPRLVSAYPLRG